MLLVKGVTVALLYILHYVITRKHWLENLKMGFTLVLEQFIYASGSLFFSSARLSPAEFHSLLRAGVYAGVM